jgi:hypothetical protein
MLRKIYKQVVFPFFSAFTVPSTQKRDDGGKFIDVLQWQAIGLTTIITNGHAVESRFVH